MNNNIDVLKELEVKNKEIYLNKLNIDLDNNEEILLITMENIINLFNNEMINKVLEIESSTFNKENQKNNIHPFLSSIQNKLIELIKKRKDFIKSKLSKIDNINYKELLERETSDIIESIKIIYNDNIDDLINKVCLDYNDFQKERVSDYLKVLNYDKFINKIKESFINMDIILYNNYLESNKRFLDLNAKTLK